ncbi:uncharacterized protein LOC123501373 [Portunus trituberculatus]|uniref:uncharacterized protein LOC123501373 n=1 Tax=Portunus trituberculatus TaxID=210409 RepID=UPI001E1CED97|nr:uncharacterized protein LOC123501373 [Portunus trituberculatus]
MQPVTMTRLPLLLLLLLLLVPAGEPSAKPDMTTDEKDIFVHILKVLLIPRLESTVDVRQKIRLHVSPYCCPNNDQPPDILRAAPRGDTRCCSDVTCCALGLSCCSTADK